MKFLENPIAPKVRKTSSKFVAPTKAEATTGRFMSPGDDYGIGYAPKVGSTHVRGIESGPIPLKSGRMNPDDVCR